MTTDSDAEEDEGDLDAEEDDENEIVIVDVQLPAMRGTINYPTSAVNELDDDQDSAEPETKRRSRANLPSLPGKGNSAMWMFLELLYPYRMLVKRLEKMDFARARQRSLADDSQDDFDKKHKMLDLAVRVFGIKNAFSYQGNTWKTMPVFVMQVVLIRSSPSYYLFAGPLPVLYEA